MDALSISELASPAKSLQNLILDGMLPGVYKETEVNNIELDLKTYVEVYLEEEVRLEGLVRNLSVFARFLELAALSLGEPVNFTSISKQIGVSIHLIIDYFQILEDCMIAWRLEALTEGGTRRRLTKAPKYLFFDMGVRRFCAREGRQYSERELGKLFEQFVGIELMKIIHQDFTQAQLKYWRDHNGPEVDYVLDIAHQYLPIEVKLTEHPTIADCKHLIKFMAEYHCFEMAYVICRCKSPRRLKENIIALPWQELPKIKALLQTRID
jgi:predicted AAA+ superfamily ATPase